MIKLCTLFSGSKGNSTLITNGNTNLLIDAGVSANRICAALRQVNLEPYELDGILITHEHRDHIGGVGTLSRKYNVPVYANHDTALEMLSVTGNISESNLREICAGGRFEIRDMEIYPFSTPHDAVAPMGYTVRSGDEYTSVATDLGCLPRNLLKHLCKSETVLIEANHDVEMLKRGPYPYRLKQRILSEKGHLSNESAAHLAVQLAVWGTKKIILGHLSEQNNTPDLALSAVTAALELHGIRTGADVLVRVAPPSEICTFSNA